MHEWLLWNTISNNISFIYLTRLPFFLWVFCCDIFIQYNYSLLRPSLILWYQVFNRNRINTSSPIKLVHILFQRITPFLSKILNILLRKYLCKNLADFSIILFLDYSITLTIDFTVFSEYSMRLIFYIFLSTNYYPLRFSCLAYHYKM